MAADKICLEGMEFFGHHGVSREEKTAGRRLVVDVEMEQDLSSAAIADELSFTTDYALVYRLVKDVVEGPGRNLIETLAEAIARRILWNTDAVAVRVRVKKPDVLTGGGRLPSASVEIHRDRASLVSEGDPRGGG